MARTKKTKHLPTSPMSNKQLHFEKELEKAMKQYDGLLKALIDK